MKKISLETFFEKFKKAVKNNGEAMLFQGKRLRFREDGRQGAGTYCPVTLVCAKETSVEYSTGFYKMAAEEIGLSCDNAHLVARAADYEMLSCGKKQQKVRARLFKISGLRDPMQ